MLKSRFTIIAIANKFMLISPFLEREKESLGGYREVRWSKCYQFQSSGLKWCDHFHNMSRSNGIIVMLRHSTRSSGARFLLFSSLICALDCSILLMFFVSLSISFRNFPILCESQQQATGSLIDDNTSNFITIRRCRLLECGGDKEHSNAVNWLSR